MQLTPLEHYCYTGQTEIDDLITEIWGAGDWHIIFRNHSMHSWLDVTVPHHRLEGDDITFANLMVTFDRLPAGRIDVGLVIAPGMTAIVDEAGVTPVTEGVTALQLDGSDRVKVMGFTITERGHHSELTAMITDHPEMHHPIVMAANHFIHERKAHA